MLHLLLLDPAVWVLMPAGSPVTGETASPSPQLGLCQSPKAED